MSNITRKVLLLASYCGDDNPGCTDDFPCDDCLEMCNVCEVDSGIKPIGGFGYLKGLIDQPQEDVCCEWSRPKGWSGVYDTGCGYLLDYEDAFKFCPCCGKLIKVKE